MQQLQRINNCQISSISQTYLMMKYLRLENKKLTNTVW